MTKRILLCFVAVLGASVSAAEAADPAEGRRLATVWCSSCHRVGAEATSSDAARPFVAIARDPYFTEDGLRAWLAAPHPPMPDLSLTRAEIEAIVAYHRALRRE